MAMPKSKSGEMPFLDHLEELRWRIIYSLGSLIVAVAVGFFICMKIDIVGLLARPILPHVPEHKLVFTHPGQGFTVILNAATTFGFVVASPVILYQVWSFLSPALHTHEKRVAIVVLISGVFLFIAGALLAYLVVVPLAIPWLMGFAGPSLIPLITAGEYFAFLFSMVMTFGLSFELPIIVLALSALGIVTPTQLAKFRRHAVVAIIVVGAFLTPGDLVWTTMWLAVPLYLLYEFSIAISFVIHRRRERKRAAREAEENAEHTGAPA
jgi:sec-independent protein translocase protein TatC